MSIPSSSDEVATTALSSPRLRASSIRTLCSRDTDPWWDRLISSPASGLISPQMRSAKRRELANRMVERWVWMSSSKRG